MKLFTTTEPKCRHIRTNVDPSRDYSSSVVASTCSFRCGFGPFWTICRYPMEDKCSNCSELRKYGFRTFKGWKEEMRALNTSPKR